jgi:hypothetical protein
MMMTQYQRHIRIAALGIASGKVDDRVNGAVRAALSARGGLVDGGDLCIAAEFKIVVDDILAEVLALISEDLMPRLRAQFPADVADAAEAELCDRVRAVIADVAETFGAKH